MSTQAPQTDERLGEFLHGDYAKEVLRSRAIHSLPVVEQLPQFGSDGEPLLFFWRAPMRVGNVPHLWTVVWIASENAWYVGGGPHLSDHVNTYETYTSTSYVDLTTVGSWVPVPYPGLYDVTVSMQSLRTAGTWTTYMSYELPDGTAASDTWASSCITDSAARVTNSPRSYRHEIDTLAVNSGLSVPAFLAKYRRSNGSGGALFRELRVQPIYFRSN